MTTLPTGTTQVCLNRNHQDLLMAYTKVNHTQEDVLLTQITQAEDEHSNHIKSGSNQSKIKQTNETHVMNSLYKTKLVNHTVNQNKLRAKIAQTLSMSWKISRSKWCVFVFSHSLSY